MINMPAQDANPEKLVQEILTHTWNHFDVEIFDKAKLEKLGCNLLLAVGAGSDFPPYMVILSPKNPPKGEKYGLIGK
jgi:leucyl aminopeptidase